MRAFRASLLLIALVMGLTAFSTVYSRRVCHELIGAVEALPTEPGEQVPSLALDVCQRFEKSKRLLLPTVYRGLLLEVEAQLTDVVAFADASPQNAGQYRAARGRLLSALEELARAQRASYGIWS